MPIHLNERDTISCVFHLSYWGIMLALHLLIQAPALIHQGKGSTKYNFVTVPLKLFFYKILHSVDSWDC